MYRWWGGGRFWEPPRPLSVLELVKSGTIDLRLAGLLWLMMEHRASVLVAAGPSSAGKTTTLNVILDFLPPRVKQVRLRGYGEDFSFLRGARPHETYIVAEEFSDYGDYIWGDVALRAFGLLEDGYSLGGTIHARTADEVVYVLHEYLGLPTSLIGRLGMIVTLRVTGGRGYASEPVRRIDSVSLVAPQKDGISIETVASRELGSGEFILGGKRALQRSLSGKFDMQNVDVAAEMEERRSFLERLLSEGKISREQVRGAIVEFYDARPS